MASIYDVGTSELIEKLSDELKKITTIKPPAWAGFVKTGPSRERAPYREDWWYVRAASVLRYVSIRGPVGVQKLRLKYGGKRNRGYKKERFYKASGNILRKVLQQLEQSGLVKKEQVGVHKGRVITPKGKSLLDKTAGIIVKKSKEQHKSEKIEVKKDKSKDKLK